LRIWYDIEKIKAVLNPAKNAIKSLEFTTTTLVNCFLELIKMTRAILEISFQNLEFKKRCVIIFNRE